MKNETMYFMIIGRLSVAEEYLKDYQEQLAGKKETYFDNDYLTKEINRLTIEIETYKNLLACAL